VRRKVWRPCSLAVSEGVIDNELGSETEHAYRRHPRNQLFNQCELTHLERQPIDLDLARVQHHKYENALYKLGCEVHSPPAEPDLPDSVFAEDVAIVINEVAIIFEIGLLHPVIGFR